MGNVNPTIDRRTSTHEVGLFHCTRCGTILRSGFVDGVPKCCEREMFMACLQPNLKLDEWEEQISKSPSLDSISIGR